LEFEDLPRGVYEVVASRGATEARGRVEFYGGTEDLLLHVSAPATAAGNATTVSVAQMKTPRKAQNELQKAKQYLQRNKPAEARAAALKALEICPDYAEAHAFLGVLDLFDHKTSDAVAELEKAVQLDPNSAPSLSALGAAYSATEHFDDALRALQSALRVDPNSWQAYMGMARAYLGKNDFAAALRSIDRARPLAPPDYSPINLVRAQALLGLKDYADAVAEYEQYLQRQPHGPQDAEVRQALNQARTLAEDRP
jgi:tetratricopeptide (TPR) repeat protein